LVAAVTGWAGWYQPTEYAFAADYDLVVGGRRTPD
jgi:hypothetical protein